MNGRLKFFNGIKGYGFIMVEGKPDLFFHHSRMQMTTAQQKKLKDMAGAEMVFDEDSGPKGPFAVNVRLKEAVPS